MQRHPQACCCSSLLYSWILHGSRVGAMGACTHKPPAFSRTMTILMLVVTLLPPSDCGCSKAQMEPRTMSLRIVARLVMGPSGKG